MLGLVPFLRARRSCGGHRARRGGPDARGRSAPLARGAPPPRAAPRANGPPLRRTSPDRGRARAFRGSVDTAVGLFDRGLETGIDEPVARPDRSEDLTRRLAALFCDRDPHHDRQRGVAQPRPTAAPAAAQPRSRLPCDFPRRATSSPSRSGRPRLRRRAAGTSQPSERDRDTEAHGENPNGASIKPATRRLAVTSHATTPMNEFAAPGRRRPRDRAAVGGALVAVTLGIIPRTCAPRTVPDDILPAVHFAIVSSCQSNAVTIASYTIRWAPGKPAPVFCTIRWPGTTEVARQFGADRARSQGRIARGLQPVP